MTIMDSAREGQALDSRKQATRVAVGQARD